MADSDVTPPFRLAAQLIAATEGRDMTPAEEALLRWSIALMWEELRPPSPPPDDGTPIFPDPAIAEEEALRRYLQGR